VKHEPITVTVETRHALHSSPFPFTFSAVVLLSVGRRRAVGIAVVVAEQDPGLTRRGTESLLHVLRAALEVNGTVVVVGLWWKV